MKKSHKQAAPPMKRETVLLFAVAHARREILAHVAAGVIPANVENYAALHDFVDANGYGGAFDDSPPAPVEDVDFWNAMQEHIDEWIRSGGLAADPLAMLAQLSTRTASAHGWAIITAAWNHLASPRRAAAHGGFGSVARYLQAVETQAAMWGAPR